MPAVKARRETKVEKMAMISEGLWSVTREIETREPPTYRRTPTLLSSFTHTKYRHLGSVDL